MILKIFEKKKYCRFERNFSSFQNSNISILKAIENKIDKPLGFYEDEYPDKKLLINVLKTVDA